MLISTHTQIAAGKAMRLVMQVEGSAGPAVLGEGATEVVIVQVARLPPVGRHNHVLQPCSTGVPRNDFEFDVFLLESKFWSMDKRSLGGSLFGVTADAVQASFFHLCVKYYLHSSCIVVVSVAVLVIMVAVITHIALQMYCT
jgi:hypothetical protein